MAPQQIRQAHPIYGASFNRSLNRGPVGDFTHAAPVEPLPTSTMTSPRTSTSSSDTSPGAKGKGPSDDRRSSLDKIRDYVRQSSH